MNSWDFIVAVPGVFLLFLSFGITFQIKEIVDLPILYIAFGYFMIGVYSCLTLLFRSLGRFWEWSQNTLHPRRK